jgi:hypothetical protein
LDSLVADMMASDLAASRVYRQIDQRKDILPFPFFSGIWILADFMRFFVSKQAFRYDIVYVILRITTVRIVIVSRTRCRTFT